MPLLSSFLCSLKCNSEKRRKVIRFSSERIVITLISSRSLNEFKGETRLRSIVIPRLIVNINMYIHSFKYSKYSNILLSLPCRDHTIRRESLNKRRSEKSSKNRRYRLVVGKIKYRCGVLLKRISPSPPPPDKN